MKKTIKIALGITLVFGVLVFANNNGARTKGFAYDPVGGGIGGGNSVYNLAYDPVGGGIGGGNAADRV
jgi:hypothetical protein